MARRRSSSLTKDEGLPRAGTARGPAPGRPAETARPGPSREHPPQTQEDLARKRVVPRMQRRQLAEDLDHADLVGKTVEDDLASDRRVLGRRPLPGGHVTTMSDPALPSAGLATRSLRCPSSPTSLETITNTSQSVTSRAHHEGAASGQMSAIHPAWVRRAAWGRCEMAGRPGVCPGAAAGGRRQAAVGLSAF